MSPSATDPSVMASELAEVMRQAGDLVAERRLPEAETQVLRALELRTGDVRARKLLALIRFRLGRYGVAEAVLRDLMIEIPDDPAVHLNLGLVGLKLDRYADAAIALGEATRLNPSDTRAWGYLGYALARTGERQRAADAFRLAGQEDLALEIGAADAPSGDRTLAEGAQQARFTAGAGGRSTRDADAVTPRPLTQAFGRTPGPVPLSEQREEFSGPRTVVTQAERNPIESARESAGNTAVVTPKGDREEARSLTAFALARLVDGGGPDGRELPGALCLPAIEGTHVRSDLISVATGDVVLGAAARRERGRLTGLAFEGAGLTFLSLSGRGSAWLWPSTPRQVLRSLQLTDDVLYVRADCLGAFSGDLAWEMGRAPRTSLQLVQFRGTGHVVLTSEGAPLFAVRVEEGQMLSVDPLRLVGWIGRIVVRGGRAGVPLVACEGEGVLLMEAHGTSRPGVHQRTEPRDHGPSGPDPRGIAANR